MNNSNESSSSSDDSDFHCAVIAASTSRQKSATFTGIEGRSPKGKATSGQTKSFDVPNSI